jgi:hypothetical protein
MANSVEITAVFIRSKEPLDFVWIKHNDEIKCFKLKLCKFTNADSKLSNKYYLINWQDWSIGKITRIASTIKRPRSGCVDASFYSGTLTLNKSYSRNYICCGIDYHISYTRVPLIWKTKLAWCWPKSFRHLCIYMIRLVKLRGGPKDVAMLIITELAKIYSRNG